MKKTLMFLLALVAVLPLMGFEIAENNKANSVIAVSENQSEFEKKAVDELKYFLEKITGAEFSVLKESEVGNIPAIYIGQTKFASANNVDFAKADKEEWILKTVGNNLIISGGRPVGSLYGVYEFLEKQGVYFLTLDQTVIPSKDKLTLPVLNERNKPCFAGRNIYDQVFTAFLVGKVPDKVIQDYWLHRLRARQNGGHHGPKRKDIPEVLYLGDMFNLTVFSHSLGQYVNPDKYFATHPEYFGMNANGERIKPRQLDKHGSLCMSNKDVRAITLDSLRGFIKRDRSALPKEEWPTIYDISILDDTPYICFCPECSKITKEEGNCGLLLLYINYVASEIIKEYPEIMIRTFAYSAARDVPKTIRPVNNVILQYCDDFPISDCHRPLTDKFNIEMLGKLKKWHDTGVKISLWDYWNMGNRYFIPPRIETITDAIQQDMKTFRDMGILGLYLEAERDLVHPQNFIDLSYFLAAQFMINPDKDQEKLIEIFMDNYYGHAAKEVKTYFQLVRDGVKNHPTVQRTMSEARWKFITPEFMLNSYKLLKQAEAKTQEGSLYRKRVHYEMIPLLWQISLSCFENEKNFKNAGISMDQITKGCREYCLEYINRNSPAKPEVHLAEFERQFAMLTAKIPVPEQFKKYSEGDIRVYGYPQFKPRPSQFGTIVDDPDSPTGKAVMSCNPSPNYYGAKTVVQGNDGRKWSFRASEFGVYNQDANCKNFIIEEPASDEKYHWYKIPKVEIASKSLFWGHCWALQLDLSQAYQLADGISNNNTWDVWFSAKFTGPAWMKDSKQKNAVYLDMVILIRPNAKVK